MLYFENWKIALICAVCALGVLLSLPNLFGPSFLAQMPKWLPHKQVALGLDLRGGSYLLLEVDVAAAQRDRLNLIIDNVRNALRGPHPISEVERLTGMVVERRAEGIALLDTSGSFTDQRFPGAGTVAQTALLLIGAMAERIDDLDAPELARFAEPDTAGAELAQAVDAGLPGLGREWRADSRTNVRAVADDR